MLWIRIAAALGFLTPSIVTFAVFPLSVDRTLVRTKWLVAADAVEGVDYDLKKPPKYENRTLGYEKTTETKFKTPRRFIQNTITHYNFYYNADIKLNQVVARATAPEVG